MLRLPSPLPAWHPTCAGNQALSLGRVGRQVAQGSSSCLLGRGRLERVGRVRERGVSKGVYSWTGSTLFWPSTRFVVGGHLCTHGSTTLPVMYTRYYTPCPVPWSFPHLPLVQHARQGVDGSEAGRLDLVCLCSRERGRE